MGKYYNDATGRWYGKSTMYHPEMKNELSIWDPNGYRTFEQVKQSGVFAWATTIPIKKVTKST
jgi:hypothetical protein